MGLETIVILGLSLFKANAAIEQSEDRAKAIAEQGSLQAKKKGKEVRLRAARQQSSFLTSGLTLEGTPMAAIQSTFATGLEDIDLISTNANKRAKNAISAGRTAAIGELAGGIAGSFGSGDIFGTNTPLGSQGSVSRTIEFGSPSVQGPIQGFGGFGG